MEPAEPVEFKVVWCSDSERKDLIDRIRASMERIRYEQREDNTEERSVALVST